DILSASLSPCEANSLAMGGPKAQARRVCTKVFFTCGRSYFNYTELEAGVRDVPSLRRRSFNDPGNVAAWEHLQFPGVARVFCSFGLSRAPLRSGALFVAAP
ncbi:unnamed protein product, partial [Symbiodinium natans]